MKKLKKIPNRTATKILLTKNEKSKFSLKKKTPVVLAKILKVLIIKNRTICFLIWPCRFENTQFLLRIKLVTAPNIDPSVVAVT